LLLSSYGQSAIAGQGIRSAERDLGRQKAGSQDENTSSEFLKSALKEEDWPHDSTPEVAFLGRSNVEIKLNEFLLGYGLARLSTRDGPSC
jgi:hypothetical protein